MKLDKTKYEDDKLDQQKEEEERLLIVMVKNYLLLTVSLISVQVLFTVSVQIGACMLGENKGKMPIIRVLLSVGGERERGTCWCKQGFGS